MSAAIGGARHVGARRIGRAAAICQVLLLGLVSMAGSAAPRTVCTITVNSADEREALRRQLPGSGYRFVELVQRGRPDWLAASCRAKVRCDVLVVSAHFDGGSTFFSDNPDASEYLTVSELERVSCNESCPALFSRLKEVYLFGCNTLNPTPQSGAYAEVVRSLVREGRSRAQAEREIQALTATGGESSRDRMRQLFPGVPVLYGFTSTAPLGAVAGPVFERYLRAGGRNEVGRGRASQRLLTAFAGFGMTAVRGVDAGDPIAAARADMCQFADDRLSTGTRLGFVHELLQRDVAEARLYLDRIEALRAGLDADVREQPAVAQVLEEIARDSSARERVLDYARRSDRYEVRVRMLHLARDAGWLTDADLRAEMVETLRRLLAGPRVGVGELNLVCGLNRDRRLDGLLADIGTTEADSVGHAAVRACLGSGTDRARVLDALLEADADDFALAQALVRQRPLSGSAELRRFATAVVDLPSEDRQARALEALGRHYFSDAEVLRRLVELYARTPSARVQAAVAGILLRADRRQLASAPLLQAVQRYRRADADDGIIDTLITVLSPRRR